MNRYAVAYGWQGMVLVLLGLAAFLSPVRADNGSPVFRLNGLDYSISDLPMPIQQAIYELEVQHYRKMRAFLDRAALDLYFEEKAAQSSRTKEQLVAEALAVPEPTESEIEAFYEKNKVRIQVPLEQVKPKIAQMLKQDRIQDKAMQLLAELEEEGTLERLVKQPSAPAVALETEGYPSKGAEQPAVTIVEFADYQCPHCKDAAAALDAIVTAYPEEVRVVYKDLPINRSGVSRKVAQGAVCAHEQGKFWAYHDLAFERQDALKAGSATELAQDLKLDMDTFKACLESERPERRIEASVREARAIGLDSTPSLFVNGRRLQLFNLDTDIREAVEEALRRNAS